MNHGKEVELFKLLMTSTSQTFFDNLGDFGIDVQQAERWLSQIASTAGDRAAYLMKRGAAGCGDSGHDDAIKYAGLRLKAVRKALGYTYP